MGGFLNVKIWELNRTILRRDSVLREKPGRMKKRVIVGIGFGLVYAALGAYALAVGNGLVALICSAMSYWTVTIVIDDWSLR